MISLAKRNEITKREAISKKIRRCLKYKHLYLMIIPGVIITFIFNYIPMYGITIGFRNFQPNLGYFEGEWVGLKYLKQFFNDPYCFRLIRNTMLLNLYSIIFGFPAPIIFALLLNEVNFSPLKRFTQSISYLPHFISTVVIVGILMKLFASDGIINQLLDSLGIKQQNFFGNPNWFRPLYVGSKIWQDTGYNAIIYLAALSGIEPHLYESAIIDGANRFKQAIYITIPGIMPTAVVLLILSIGRLLNVGFEKVYLMYSPAIYEKADVISTYVYRRGIQGFDYSYATVIDFFNSVVALVLITIANTVCRKVTEESLW
ncbi:MAG TPA: sugar ABC transporter permease [Clostridiales bacterium]|nr:sugar ABC transporter permease [Clostridiales bacterium]